MPSLKGPRKGPSIHVRPKRSPCSMLHRCTATVYLLIFCTDPHDNILTMNLSKTVWFLTADWFLHIITAIVFLFFPPWRWWHELPKHVAGYFVIELHSYIRVHFVLVLNNAMHLINARTAESTKRIKNADCIKRGKFHWQITRRLAKSE